MVDILPGSPNQIQERKEKLNAIKKYIFSLLKKNNEKHKQDLQKALESKSKEELEKKKNKNMFDKLKNLFGNQDSPEEKISKLETAPEDQDEYIPQDLEIGETMGESNRFGEIFPYKKGYYINGKKSYFDSNTNLWSKKKKLQNFEHTIQNKNQVYTYVGYIKNGICAIPLPDSALPDTKSLVHHGTSFPIFKTDQNNCIYLESKEKQIISFQFALGEIDNTNSPITQDGEKIIYSKLSAQTKEIMEQVAGKKAREIGKILEKYISHTKKYSTKQQGTLRNKSNKNNYISNIDHSPVLECFSANSLLVALCRELDIPARLVTGFLIQQASKDGKGYLTKNNGHAWTEIWDGAQWIRLDATPIQKEDGEESGQNMNESGENSDQDGDTQNSNQNETSNEQKEEDGNTSQNKEGKDKQSQEDTDNKEKSGKPEQKTQDEMTGSHDQKPKSPEDMLEEFIQKAKEDSLIKQSEDLQETLDQLKNAQNKEDIKDILDNNNLEDFAKDIIDKIGNTGILEEEKNELQNIDDEKELEKKLQESLLDPEYKRRLEEYANILKKKIEEQKKKLKSEMERFGFKEEELALYKRYKELEKEVRPEVSRQISELQKILPPNYILQRDKENHYRSGSKLDRKKLVDWKIDGNTKIFQRSRIQEDTQEINMFETILIDRSGSMGNFNDRNSPFFQSIKAAITRAKVLEHFKVDMSIVVFDDSIDEVMNFGETFSDRKTKIPSKLMRAATRRSGGNSQEPITLVYNKMKEKMREAGGRSFGNISFIGDGDLYNFNQVPQLKAMINDLKKQGMGVTAYYINNHKDKMPLIEYYFGNPEDGNAVYAKDSGDLSQKIIGNHRTKLNMLIKKYLKQ